MATDIPAEELDQLVVATFLGVIADFPLGCRSDRTLVRARTKTQRRVFRQLAKMRREQELECPLDATTLEASAPPRWPSWQNPVQSGPPSPAEVADAVCLLVEQGSDVLSGENFALVTTVSICGRSIGSYVQNRASESHEGELNRLRRNAKRRHSRAVARLRKKMAPMKESRVPGRGVGGFSNCRRASAFEGDAT